MTATKSRILAELAATSRIINAHLPEWGVSHRFGIERNPARSILRRPANRQDLVENLCQFPVRRGRAPESQGEAEEILSAVITFTMNGTTSNSSHDDTYDGIKRKEEAITERKKYKTVFAWPAIFYNSTVHIIGLYGLFTFDYFQNWKTTLWLLIMYELGCIGVTAGAHRLWSHRSYSANLPLRLFLFVGFCSSAQVSVYSWVRTHRVHHKFVDTDLDPHNSRRGFFFCHIGWLLAKFNSEVVQKLREVDLRDIMADPIIVFQKKYYARMLVIFAYILPTLVPVYFWGETWNRSFISQVVRVLLVLHATLSINSFAHMYGTKPYDKNIWPTDNLAVSLVISGEGFHNYHHVFPWDYRASEFNWYILNHSAFFIDMFAKIGWAYNLKKPSPDLVKRVAASRGDGSRAKWDEVPLCD